MVGSGDRGPPRKSHTKSRKGCKTCKRRHIRCDESFPQCRNCTKHNCRCDYMDLPSTTEEPSRGSRPPDLMMTQALENEIERWRVTGEAPFPDLNPSSRAYWSRFSTVDLRLIQHIARLSIDMQQLGYSGCTVWAQKMPMFLQISLSNDFVMSAILALSASHLAWKTKDSETDHLAYHHRGVALKSLHEAIGSFSRDNSEAILAASMLLSWQATEWRSWASLQQGVSTVTNAMRPWMHESKLASFLETQRSIGRSRTPVTPTYPSSTLQPRPEDLARLDRANTALHELEMRLGNNEELAGYVSELLGFLQNLRHDFPIQAPETAFERLQELRSWLFWLPPELLRPSDPDLGALTVLSHFFAVALALDALFPEIGGAYLANMSIAPVEEMRHILLSRRASNPQDTGVQYALALTEEPVAIVTDYKNRLQFLMQQSEAYQAPPRSPYAVPSMPLTSSLDTMPPPRPYAGSPMPSPNNLTVPGSSYFPPGSHAGSISPYGERSPSHRPQMLGEKASSFHAGGGPGGYAYGNEQKGVDAMTSGVGYHETPAFQTYGAATGNLPSNVPEGKGKQRQA